MEARHMEARQDARHQNAMQRNTYRWAWVGCTLMMLMLLLSACTATTVQQNDNGSQGNNTATDTSTPTATQSGDSGAGTPVPTTPSGPTPFAVNGITLSVSPDNFSGACSSTMVFTFTAQIMAPAGTAGGVVKYRWYRSDGASSSSDQTVTFAAGETVKTVTTTWSLGSIWGNGTSFWEKVKTSVPNVWYSPEADFHFTCHFGVASASLSVSPASYNCTLSSQTFTFSGTITLNPAPGSNSITYHWLRTDGGHTADTTVPVAAGVASVPVSTTWTIFPATAVGDYGEHVVLTKINGVALGSPITSNTPTFHKGPCF
jgi:hypothetical protein